jgi:subtilase family serine protease
VLGHNKMISSIAGSLRRPWIRTILAVGAVVLLVGGAMGVYAIRTQAASPSFDALPNSLPAQVSKDQPIGHHDGNAQLTVELVLQSGNQAGLDRLIGSLYDPHSSQFHQWLPTGAFERQFGPSRSQLEAARSFLRQAGLHLADGSPSAFLLRATGTTSQMEAAFHTRINDYRGSDSKTYFANATSLQIPASLNGVVQGVVGLDNLARAHTNTEIAQAGTAKPHFGGGPGGTGLTPSQIAGIYLADPLYALGNKGKGAGKTLAVFELSGYTQSDIGTYESQFGLPSPTLTNINVDGGPTDNTGAGEVELDIELQIALAPMISGVLVYNAPNTGQGLIDQYAKIASDNKADAISTSWGLCEAFSVPGIWDSEFTSFEQMAAQGQSIFAAAGDSGAFDCLPHGGGGGNGSNQVDDPGSNPYMTSVGGTSLAVDPGSNANPTYQAGEESVWNDGCTSAGCPGGSGGGGNSRIWAKPRYQAGPGVTNGYSQFSPWCSQPSGTQCREVPDVSMNADENTGYAIFCTDPVGCGIGATWLQFGGTSCAAPLWAAIAALTDSFHNNRLGEPSFSLYQWDSTSGYTYLFHDITSGNNGWFPARANYDQATGIGTPRIYYIATTLP